MPLNCRSTGKERTKSFGELREGLVDPVGRADRLSVRGERQKLAEG